MCSSRHCHYPGLIYSVILAVLVSLLTNLPVATAAVSTKAILTPPLYFELNVGQAQSDIRFLAQGFGATALIGDTGVEFLNSRGATVHLRFPGSRKGARLSGAERLAGESNYLTGNDRSKWQTGVPHFASVRQQELYAGIDAVYHPAPGGRFEYDFVVAPHANPKLIEMQWEGAGEGKLNASGDLVFAINDSRFVVHAPTAYQEFGGRRTTVEAKFVRRVSGRVGIRVGSYDESRPLVIDPEVTYSTYLGTAFDWSDPGKVAVDAGGNIYVARDVRVGNSFRVQLWKLDSSGANVLLTTTLGGSGHTQVTGLLVDPAGNIWLCGGTSANDFPTVRPIQGSMAGAVDAFLVKLAPDGKTILFSTFLGGTGSEGAAGSSMAMDPTGALYLVLGTTSRDFPTTAGAFQTGPGGPSATAMAPARDDLVVLKIGSATNGTPHLVYSTYFGGSATELLFGSPSIAADGVGNVYFTGASFSTDLPLTTNVYSSQSAGDYLLWTFVAKLNPAGSALLFSTFLRGSVGDAPGGIAVDEMGHVFLSGATSSRDFPTTPGAWLREAYPSPGASDGQFSSVGFLAKFNNLGSELLYSTFIGRQANSVKAMMLDPSGSVVLTGRGVPTFPVGLPVGFWIGRRAFVAVMNPEGSRMDSVLYGVASEQGTGLARLPSGRVVVSGTTFARDLPVSANAIQPAYASFGGQPAAFLAIAEGFQYLTVKPCVTALVADLSPFGSEGGTGTLQVVAPTGCEWSAVSTMPFVRIVQGASGLGNGTMTVSVNPKAVGDAGVSLGAIVVGPLVAPIIQSAAEPASWPFDDVQLAHPFANHILVAGERFNLASGSRTFGPDLPVTRRFLARALARAVLGSDSFPVPSQPYFTDIPATDPDFRYIQKLRELGITNGCTADRFCPEQNVTRGQAAAFFTRSTLGPNVQSQASAYFTDVPATHTFFANAQRIRDWGITAGCTATTYCPDLFINRGQLAVFLTRAFLTPR